MADLDLNLLIALDALLAEGSVVGAARRLDLSASAMSRTLARLRAATGDPLLVRAGRGLVPTPCATELRKRVRDLAQDAQTVLRPAVASLTLAELKRSFTIRANEGFVEIFAAQLVAAVTAVAPNVRLRFAPKPDKDVRALREGLVDLEIGVLGKSGPEVRLQTLFRDHFVCAVREGHPLLGRGKITAERYAAFVLGGILLPLEYWHAVFLCLMLAALTAGIWYSIKLRHERLVVIASSRSSRANI